MAEINIHNPLLIIFLLQSRQNLGQGMTFESLMTLTDDSEMRWAEWLGNALVRMSEDLNLKNQTVWRLSLQIQTDWRQSQKYRPRTEAQSQAIRKALGQRNTVLSKI